MKRKKKKKTLQKLIVLNFNILYTIPFILNILKNDLSVIIICI